MANSNKPLTPREIEIYRMIANGMKSKGISESLGISMRTVESYRASINRKTSVAISWDIN